MSAIKKRIVELEGVSSSTSTSVATLKKNFEDSIVSADSKYALKTSLRDTCNKVIKNKDIFFN